MSKYLNIIAFLIVSFSPKSSYSRYATFDEAPYEVRLMKTEINIEKDGKYTEIKELAYKINNELGRQTLSSYTIFFSKDTSELEIIKAYTENDGYVTEIDTTQIEIKPLASTEKGFDQKYQALISYPNVVVGSTLYIKYRERFHFPVIDGHFFYDFYFGFNNFVSKSNIKINSKIEKLKLEVNDKNGYLDIKTSNEKDGSKTYYIIQNRPLYFELINEPSSIQHDLKNIPYIRFSSLISYDEIVNHFYENYNLVINEDLPDIFNYIVEDAKKIEDKYDKIDFVTSKLAEKIRYMGSWQTIKGKYFPRTLKEITKTGYADCKEYSVSLSAMLNKLGFKANAAFIMRGLEYIKPQNNLPSMSEFNHAIVYAESADGEALWLDPTNFVSMSRHIFPDISGRPSLVLSKTMQALIAVPVVDYKKALIETSQEFVFSEDKSAIKGEINFTESEALPLTGAELAYSKKYIEEYIIKKISDDADAKVNKFSAPDLSSRIVKDINIKYDIEASCDFIFTNAGKIYKISTQADSWIKAFHGISKDQKGVVFLSSPYTHKKKNIVRNFYTTNPEKLNYSISNKWFDASRKAIQNNNDLVIEEILSLKNSYIFPDEINFVELRKISDDVKRYVEKTFIVDN